MAPDSQSTTPLAYTVRDVAKLLRCGPFAARSLVKKLGAFTIGTSKTANSKLYIRADVLHEWLERQSTSNTSIPSAE